MTTPSGQISMYNIASEFGPITVGAGTQNYFGGLVPTSVSLGNFRKNVSIAGQNWPLDDGVPSSGEIRLSQLRNKIINTFVDYTGTQYGVDSATEYRNRAVAIHYSGILVAPGANNSGRSFDSVAKKVRHIIRGTIGGSKSLSSLSPTSPLTNTSGFLNMIQSNTLGTFIVSGPSVISPSQYGSYGGTSCSAGQRNCVPRPPSTGTTLITANTITANVTLSGGAIISMRREDYRNIYTQSSGGGRGGGASIAYLVRTLRRYYVTGIVSGGNGYAPNQSISGSWDGRTFTFTVTGTSSAPALRTGTGWNGGDQLLYYIKNGGRIYGTGGSGGVGGYPGTNGENGGNAFQVQSNLSLIHI